MKYSYSALVVFSLFSVTAFGSGNETVQVCGNTVQNSFGQIGIADAEDMTTYYLENPAEGFQPTLKLGERNCVSGIKGESYPESAYIQSKLYNWRAVPQAETKGLNVVTIEGKISFDTICGRLNKVRANAVDGRANGKPIHICAGDLDSADFTHGATKSALSDGHYYIIVGKLHEGTLSVDQIAAFGE